MSNQNLNSTLSRYREIPRYFISSIWTSWIKSFHHPRFRLPFHSAFRVSFSKDRLYQSYHVQYCFLFTLHSSLHALCIHIGFFLNMFLSLLWRICASLCMFLVSRLKFNFMFLSLASAFFLSIPLYFLVRAHFS